ncbi:hypothetical protein GFH30_00395 [Acinetobacter wanghuae]|uniref:DUF4136 domain-containing protein n=1 Tax=Acinetobacter wanghuae TaxID=2662362 RepID=A0A5Q0P272_9GAMM|nr:hypothetical protein [Acinetobacter wanghuae]MQW91845.1 hypothetical protein [Acinetobacter wanghuae]QGA09948.1 hypothetical protein GFH30_00395 [Acinetobacter wanghuae]
MKTWILGLAAAAVIGLSGCASTPTKPRTFDQLGQFSTTPLNQQTYRVSFKALPNMSFGTAEEIALLKSAQTTVQQGFQFFKVIDDPSNRTQQPPREAVVYPAPRYHSYGYYRRGAFAWPDPFYDAPYSVTVDPAQVAYTIQCYKEKQAPSDAFDARLILQSLGQKYGLGPTGEVLQPQTTTPAQ